MHITAIHSCRMSDVRGTVEMSENRMPVIFIGHGSPMNVINKNEYTDALVKLSTELPVPRAILVISAHWLTKGTFITGSEHPDQIYDFYGFPDELYRVRYRAPGSQEIASLVSASVPDIPVAIDTERGIDHAAWAVLKHLYPDQNIPVLELSLNFFEKPEYHYRLGKTLGVLRNAGILIIGSGNIVHNLHEISYDDEATPYRWAVDFDGMVKEKILGRDDAGLIDYESMGAPARKAVPTNDHYLPLLYVIGQRGTDENVKFITEIYQNASVAMRSFIIG
jgi:4,5-DOPA dioxygenase extradiol